MRKRRGLCPKSEEERERRASTEQGMVENGMEREKKGSERERDGRREVSAHDNSVKSSCLLPAFRSVPDLVLPASATK